MPAESTFVKEIRDVSRMLVREWGFMGGHFAGTTLSPSTVHALIEIEKNNLTARDLGASLRLEKSSVSRMLRKMLDAGDIKEETGQDDGRSKVLSLTASGKHRVEAIHNFANTQVINALKNLNPEQEQRVLEGLRLYSNALQGIVNPAVTIDIISGYQLGLIASITEMHIRYYSQASGFGQHFESVVSSGLAEFCSRLANPKNAIWTAVKDGKIVGSIAIDGEDLGANIAHLRWFIVDNTIRGGGVGRQLLSKALAFVDSENQFTETHLTTIDGLPAARHLYEDSGFVCVEEQPGTQWGKEALEQIFVRR